MGFCDSGQKQSSTNTTQWVDPLGPSSVDAMGGQRYAATGAPQYACYDAGRWRLCHGFEVGGG